MNIHQDNPLRPRVQAPGLFGSNSDVVQAFFAYEKNLTSDDLGQVVKSLSEMKKIIYATENKLLLNSAVSKIVNNFETTKNIHKYQYLEFFKTLKPFYQGIQNKKEILDITSKLLTSNDYICRIISTQLITLMKEFIEDRVDVLHNLTSVALSTKSQLEIRYMFKSFNELCEASEAFSFTFLQQFRGIFEKFRTVVPVKKLVVLIQKAARNITKQENLSVLVENIKINLETDCEKILLGSYNLDMLYADLIFMGNLLLYSFSHTSQIAPLLIGVFFFLTDNKIVTENIKSSAHETPYSLCRLIINLFKKLFKVVPPLQSLLSNELNQMVNKVTGTNSLNPTMSNKIFLEIISMLDSDATLGSITDFFAQLSDELKLGYLQHHGNIFQFKSSELKELFLRRIKALDSGLTEKQLPTIELLKTLDTQDILALLREIKGLIVQGIKDQSINEIELQKLLELELIIVLSLKLHVQQSAEDSLLNIYLLLQDDIWPVLNSLKTIDQKWFDPCFKKVFLIILELGKVLVKTAINPHRYEKAVVEYLKNNLKSSLSKPLQYWMIQKSFINNNFMLCKWLIQEFTPLIHSEKIGVWIDILKNLCNICSNDTDQSKNIQLLKILNSMKSIKSEDSFSYQYLRHFYLLSTALQALQNALYNKISIEKPLMQIYNYLGQLKSLQDRYFVDEFSRVSLKILVYGLEFIIALVENPVELINQGNLENRLDLINNKMRKWISYIPFHDGEVEVMKYFKAAYQNGVDTKDWENLRTSIITDFLNFKVITFPRKFLDFKPPLDLKIKLVNQDEYINKKTHEINTQASLSYVMDVRIHVNHLPKDFSGVLDLQAESTVKFHHNYGSPDDVTYQVSRIIQNHSITPAHKQIEISFLLHFASIGKFTNKMTINLINKKKRIVYSKTETWLINAA